MTEMLLSDAEQMYIVHGVQNDYRCDGRGRLDYRPIELETDIVSNASGSARLRLANTDILVGIKSEVDVPTLDKKDQGKIEFFVDCSANATPEFEGRGGEQLGALISNCLTRAYESSAAFDLKQLCILAEKQCWKLYVDILILECGGNLFDAVSLAVKAALFNTQIPRVECVVMDGVTVDLKLSDDMFECIRLNIGNAPLLVTLSRIGLDGSVVDPSAEEENCSPVSIVMGVTGDPRNYGSTENSNKPIGKITTIMTPGKGSIHTSFLPALIKDGCAAGLSLDKALGKALLKEVTQRKSNDVRYGFLK